jgi:glucans biosynthesis protein
MEGARMMSRRGFLAQGTATLALFAAPVQAAMPRFLSDEPFDVTTVEDIARTLSQSPYAPRPIVPEAWRDLTYDEYRKIWFNTSKAVWAETGLPVQMDLFHPGLYFPQAVEVDVVEEDRAHRLAFDYDLFDKTDRAPDLPIDETMGYSGLRLRAELVRAGIYQEFCVFQGASYFRALATGQNYGLSARGLALRTGDAEGEEFPDFVRFWMEAPAHGDTTFILHALLDSPSVTGAYRFEITPGAACEMVVHATLFPRVTLDHVGIAPLTSMFLYDETNRETFRDFRPAVHDSDGLLVWNGAGEMLWRPLANPRDLAFVDANPRGFGLMQRARDFKDFEDLEAHYHTRPSAWVEPMEDWGAGVVRLVEIPADKEIYDNIVAYWRPHTPLEPGIEHRFSYRLTWGEEPARRRDVARVANTFLGLNFNQDAEQVVIDFEGHTALAGELDAISVHVSSNEVTLSPGLLQRLPDGQGVRLAFSFDPQERTQAELRAQLMRDGQAISEVWLYRWRAPA